MSSRLAVRWYLRFGLSYRDVEELLAERGIQADHVTSYQWVLRFTPLLADAARWRYAYRPIDQFGQVIDVYVSSWRDTKAAHRFFERATGRPRRRPGCSYSATPGASRPAPYVRYVDRSRTGDQAPGYGSHEPQVAPKR
jgi:hypothetical protein